MAPFEGAPLLPVDDGAALAPLTPHGAVVRGEGWSESASRALEALGVRRLAAEDPAGVAAAARPLSPRYARPATAAGTLDSAVAAASRLVPPEELVEAEGTNGGARARAGFGGGAVARGGAAGAGGFETRGPDAPRAEGAARFLTQRRWFQNGTQNALVGARLDLLRSLPVFERCEPVRDATRASEPRASAAAASFVSLDATPSPLVAPEEAPSRLLTSSFLSLDSEDEALVLTKHCRVPRADTVAFFSAHVLPALASGELAGSLAPSARTRRLENFAPRARAWTGAADRKALGDALASHACVRPARRRFTSPAGSFRPDGFSDRSSTRTSTSRRRRSTRASASPI